MPFVHETTARFGQTDPAGIVYFARFFEMAHEAFEECLIAGGLSLQAIFATADWAMPLVHAEADYKAPVRLGDRLHVVVAEVVASASSLTYTFEVRAAEGGRVHATVRHVHVAVERASFAKRGVPAAMRAALLCAGVAVRDG